MDFQKRYKWIVATEKEMVLVATFEKIDNDENVIDKLYTLILTFAKNSIDEHCTFIIGKMTFYSGTGT